MTILGSGDPKFDELQKRLYQLKTQTPPDAVAISAVEAELANMRDERAAKAQHDLQQRLIKSLLAR